MRSIFGKMILAPVILAAAALAIQSANAESFAKVPFKFVAAGRVWPAGEYSIQKNSSSTAVTLTSKVNQRSFNALLGPGDAAPTDTNVTLRFDDFNGVRMLRDVQYTYEVTGRLDKKALHSEHMIAGGR